MSLALNDALARKSIADVTQRKGRTLVVVLSIFIGVFGLTGINVFAFKTTDAYARQQDRSHYPDIIFSVNHVDDALIQQVRAIPNVQTVQTQMMGTFQWQAASGPTAMNIVAFPDPQHVQLGRFDLVKGRYPGSGETVLEMSDVALQSFSLGDVIQVKGPRGTTPLRVVGIVQTSGLPGVRGSKTAQAYMRIADLSQILGTTTANSIAIKVQNINAVHDTVQALSTMFQQEHLTAQVTMIQSGIGAELGLDFVLGFFNIVRTLAAGAIVVSCFLIMNTLTTLVAEQMKIIGTMKAIGGTRSTVLLSYLFTIFIYSILGTFLGLVLGIAIGYTGASQFAQLKLFDLGPPSIPLNVFLIGIAAGIVVPLLAALITLLDGTRITVREALSAYGVTGVSSGRWQSLIAERLSWLPQTVWLGMRGIFRKRGRAIMTIVALMLSGITFLAVTTFTYSIAQMIQHLRENYTYDMTVATANYPASFRHSLPQLQQIVGALPNVALVEPGTSTGARTQSGLIDLEGIDVNTHVYHKPIVTGRWFKPGERDVLLLDEQTLLQAHLSVGDTITLTNDNGHQFHWKIIGAVHDTPTVVQFGELAITSIENVNRLDEDPANSIGVLYIQARDHSSAALSQLEQQVDQVLQQQQEDINPASTKREQLDVDEHGALSICIIFYVAAAGVALVGLLGLYNTLTSSVLERKREIGLWRSMGASNWQVSQVFWIEGLSLVGLAWMLGAIVGIPVAYGFMQLVSQWLFPVPFAFDLASLPLMLLALVLIATLACFGPTARASRARIAEILRYE